MLKLSSDRKVVVIDANLQLKVGATISYKPTDDEQVGMGKIVELRHPGPKQSDVESVWAAIADAVSGEVDWIPVSLWVKQREEGMFDEEPIITKPKTKASAAPTPTVAEEPTVNNSSEPGILPTGEPELW